MNKSKKNNFDYFILSLICIDAVALGFMTSDITNVFFDNVLFILDRLCMAIFIMEMLMKLYAYGKGFFKSGWNVFDLIVVAVSSVPFASYFIVLRTFRLFRSLKYVNKFSRLKSIINTFIALLPIFVAMLAVFVIFFYVFAIMAVCITLCPVFSGEYQAGTDAVILSAKYGKTKLTTAKVIASVLFGLIAFTLHIIVAFGIPLTAFGIDGWNLPMQIANTTIPYHFTFLQGALINLGVIYLVLLAMISLTLFLSAKVKSPYIVLTVLFRMGQRDYII